METTFNVGMKRKLRVGHNVCEPNTACGSPFIGMLLEDEIEKLGEPSETRYFQVAYLKPHEARAMASVLLSLATDSKR